MVARLAGSRRVYGECVPSADMTAGRPFDGRRCRSRHIRGVAYGLWERLDAGVPAPTGDPADALAGNSTGDPDIPSGPPSASADEPSTPAAETSDALMVGEGSPADEQVPTEVPDPAADDGAPALDVAPLAAAVEEVVPDISVVPTPEDVTFYWPDFGVAADQGVPNTEANPSPDMLA